ncbi:MAG TPA: cupredoxin domain-containing protein [Myxococcota bacterium]|jgi:plastocyanin|nr:cupredoxin domain-containing protein [Myxococcota bacterium]
MRATTAGLVAAGLALAATGAGAGCGSDGGGGGGSGSATGAATGAGTAAPTAAAKAPLPPGVVEVEVTEKGFVPERIAAKKGELLTLLVTRKTEKTCATEITMKDPPINQALPLNVPVEVKITPTKAGELVFMCAMGMVGGTIEVAE